MDTQEAPYNPYKFVDPTTARPHDVTLYKIKKRPVTGFRKPAEEELERFATQTQILYNLRYRWLRHSYTALPPNHIRVLVIRPGRVGEPGKVGDRLELDLLAIPFEAPYTQVKSYDALSYEWDDGPAVFPVILRDWTIHTLEERFPINEDEKAAIQTPRGNRNSKESAAAKRAASMLWRRALFRVFRDCRYTKFTVDGNHVSERRVQLGTRAFIQSNLHNALLRIRHPENPIPLWADALCINQPDNEEKMIQIARMGDIYNRAERVRIWLGTRSENSDIAMEYIYEILDQKALRGIFSSKEYAEEVRVKWPALVELMRSRWFSRRWVVQELVLSRAASIYCGDKKVAWEDFSSAIADFMEQASPEKLSQHTQGQSMASIEAEKLEADDGSGTQISTRILTPEGLRTLKGSGANALVAAKAELAHLADMKVEDTVVKKAIITLRKPLEELVSTLTPFDCGDPRDIIYAVLTLAGNKPQEQLRPNNNKSLLQTYTEFIRYCVDNSGSLDMLCRYWTPKNTIIVKEVSKKDKRQFKSRLPTWMRTLEHSTYGTPDRIFVGQKEAESLVGSPSRPLYQACGSRKPQVSFGKKLPVNKPVVLHEEFDGTIMVKGIKLGVVTKLSPRMIPGIVPQEALELGGWMYSMKEADINISKVPDGLLRTLVADKTKEGATLLPNYPTYCLRTLQKADVHGDIHIDKILQETEADDGMFRFLQRIREVTFNRKLFTGDGLGNRQLIGLCPKQTQPGDFLCILYGCRVPVVLRPRKSRGWFGLDPSCNNDPTERKGPQAVATLGQENMPSNAPASKSEVSGTPKSEDKAAAIDEPFFDEEPNPWAEKPVQDNTSPGSSTKQVESTTEPERSRTPLARASTYSGGQVKVEEKGQESGEPRLIPPMKSVGDNKTDLIEGDFYEVVGECYVDRMMDGEQCTGSRPIPWEQDFTLI